MVIAAVVLLVLGLGAHSQGLKLDDSVCLWEKVVAVKRAIHGLVESEKLVLELQD